MSAAMDAYTRLIAARRIVTPQEQDERAKVLERQMRQASIRRKLPKVY